MPTNRKFGRRAVEARRFTLARDRGICGLCGHPGANTWGHIIPVHHRPDLEWNSSNWQAQHGSKAGNDGGCLTPHCECPGNYSIGDKPYKRPPSREW